MRIIFNKYFSLVVLTILAGILNNEGHSEMLLSLESKYILNLDRDNEKMKSVYGLAPIESNILNTIGFRNFHTNGSFIYGNSFFIGNHTYKEDESKTTANISRLGFIIGAKLSKNIFFLLDGGFSAFSFGFESPFVGGSAVYLGPYAQVNLMQRIIEGSLNLMSFIGAWIMIPQGVPHEGGFFRSEDFKRSDFKAFTLGLAISF